MALSSCEISRLVHHHLLKQGYVNSANTLITECPDLCNFKPVQAPVKIPRLVGPSLDRLIEAYHETKDLVIEELELLKSTDFNYEDSVPSLFKCYKQLKSFVSMKETFEKSVNTEETEMCFTKTCDAQTSTEEDAITKHAVSPESVITQLPIPNQGCNHNGSVEEPNQSDDIPSESDHSSYNGLADTVDFSMMYDRLLEAGDLHEKIAERINKKKGSSPQKESPSNDGFTQHFDSIVRAIVAETQADPAFESIIQECIGIDSDLSSAETPSSVDHNTDAELHMPSSSVDQSKMTHEETPFDGQAVQSAPLVPESGFMMPKILQPAQNSTIITGSSLMNSLNTYTIVTGADGQIALVPATFAAATSTPLPVETRPKGRRKNAKAQQDKAPKPPKPSTAVVPVVRPRATPMPILPKPIVINLEEITSKVDAAVSEALSGCSLQVETNAAPPIVNDKVVAKLSSRQPKMLRTTRLLSQRTRKPQYRRVHPVPCSSKPQSSPAKLQSNRLTQPLLDLCSIARGLCETIAPSGSVSEQEAASIEVQKSSTPTPDSVAFVSTPTSTRRRSSHVRQLNFGESPDTPNASSPKVRRSNPLSSDIPWDSALRGITNATVESNQQPAPVEPEPEVSLFATPKGKAKRARKSPLFRQANTSDPTTTDEPVAVASPITETPQPQPETSSSDATMFSVPEQVQPNSPSAMQQMYPNLIANSETSDADLVAASILSEMANTPFKEVDPKILTTDVAAPSSENSLPNLPNFGRGFAMQAPSVFQQLHPSMPVLSTPRKEPTIQPERGSGFKSNVMFDPHTSSSFSTWDGEIPKTPQIQTDLTSSSSPFLVSLTKGFRFLPAADSPSLAVPSTPSIGGESHSNSNSLQTPYTGFYQFPSILNTPRVEALRQELMESPGKNSTNTMISPTQVVLGRSAPYFVPSGERSQGPFFNQNATPEHIPEADKLERRRRSCSTEMDPLQLEESNDASDEAADLLRQAAANAAAALQPPTPYKTDQRLESDLINECQRLEVPSVETTKLRKERLVELFGEETTTLSEAQQPSPLDTVPVPLANQSESLEEGTSKKRTTKPRKSKTVNSLATYESCARFQDYPSSSYFADRITKRLSNSSSASNQEVPPSAVGGLKSAHDERIIQEILASHGIKSSLTPSSSNSKRKRKSVDSTSTCPDSSDISPAQKKSRRSKNTSPGSPQSSTSTAPPSEHPLHSSRDETDGADVDIMELDASTTFTEGSSKETRRMNKVTRAQRVQPPRVNKPNVSAYKSSKSPSKNKTPVKLFNKSSSSSAAKVNLQRHLAVSHHTSCPSTTATDTSLTSIITSTDEPKENLPNPNQNGDVGYLAVEPIRMNEEEPPPEVVTESTELVKESSHSAVVIAGEETALPEPSDLVQERSCDGHKEEEEPFSIPSLAVDPPTSSSEENKISKSSPFQNVREDQPCLQRPVNIHSLGPLVIPVEAITNGLKDPRPPPPTSVTPYDDSLIFINIANWTEIIPSFSENSLETNLLTDATAVPVCSPNFNQQKTLPVTATPKPCAHRSDPALQNYLKLVHLSTNNNPGFSPSLVASSKNNLAESQPCESPTANENAVVQSKSGQSQVQKKAKSAFNSVVATYKKKLSLSTTVNLYSQ